MVATDATRRCGMTVLTVPDSVTAALEYLRGKVLNGGLNAVSWPWASLGRSWLLEMNLFAVKLKDLWLEVGEPTAGLASTSS